MLLWSKTRICISGVFVPYSLQEAPLSLSASFHWAAFWVNILCFSFWKKPMLIVWEKKFTSEPDRVSTWNTMLFICTGHLCRQHSLLLILQYYCIHKKILRTWFHWTAFQNIMEIICKLLLKYPLYIIKTGITFTFFNYLQFKLGLWIFLAEETNSWILTCS